MSYYLSSLGYPFRERPFVFVFGVFMLWAMQLAEWAPVIGGIAIIFLAGYLCAFFMKIVQTSIMEDEDGICLFPEFEGWIETIFMPCVRFLACMVFSLLPLILYFFFEGEDWGWILLLRLAGAVYFPLAFMRTAALESLSGLSPLAWVRIVRRIPLAYAGLVLFFLAGLMVLGFFPDGFLFNLVLAPLKLYILCVSMNVFGLFMRKHEEAMGWGV